MRQKILIIDNSIAFTGAFKCALMEALLLKDKFDFVFVVPNDSLVIAHLKKSGFTYYSLPLLEISKSLKSALYLPRLLQNALRLRSIVSAEKVNIVQVNDFYNLLGACLKVLGYKGKLITYVRFLPSVIPTPLRKLWIQLAQNKSDVVIAVSDAVLHQLPSKKNTVRIYNHIEFEERLPYRKIDTLSGNTAFLYISNYIKGKGQDYALQAFVLAIKENPHLSLLFVGSDMGLKKNSEFKQELQAFVQENGLTDKVRFEHFRADLEEAIKSADVVLNFSEAESFSMTCAEASFYGKPVIATRCGGPEEIIVDEQTGLLVENKNIIKMKEAILKMAAIGPVGRIKMGESAKIYTTQKFSASNFEKQFISLILKNEQVSIHK